MGGVNTTVSRPQLSPLDEKRDEVFRQKEEKIIQKSLACDVSQDEEDGTEDQTDETDSSIYMAELGSYKYPFENLIFEGGGNKGLAYCGAIKCLEEVGVMPQIKRFAGSSAGALTAALVAVGYNSKDIERFMAEDVEHILLDHSYGYLSLVPNMLSGWGWNPGRRILEWIGEKIKYKTCNANLTFYELYEMNGVELCVVITNLNLMKSEFCHPKTTPNMIIREALRISISIPVVFMACTREDHGQKDVYVDGGVLCNYPIQCFDGWYLSMDKKDAFLLRMQQLDDLSQMFYIKSRFRTENSPALNQKSLGFLLYGDLEAEVMREVLEKRPGSVKPAKPSRDTKLYKQKLNVRHIQRNLRKEREQCQKAAEAFMKALQKHNLHNEVYIDKEELRAVFEDEAVFSLKNRKKLFGKDVSLEEAFNYLDKDKNGKIDILELLRFLEKRNVHIQTRIQGYSRSEINTLFDYGAALQNSWMTNLKYLYVELEDYKRTVGINTGHVGASNYVLENEDREFIIDRGYNATVAYLRYFVQYNTDRITKNSADSESNVTILT